ncbi:MAG: hypothetical protein CMP65_03545 [Flavobacteriales bacterium]|nr:hypothetical protein [Flavobacteriales bacterium]
MNRLFFYALIINGICTSQEFNAGIIAGINTSQVSGDNLAGFNKLGTKSGVFINTMIHKFIGQLELQYINKGSRERVDENDYNEGYKFQLNYAEIPLTIKVNTYKNTFIEFGLSLAYLLKSYEKINGYEEFGLKVNKYEYSTHIGIDYLIKERLVLNTRISNSILPIRKHSSGQVYRWNKGQYNTSISFVFYYYL